MSGNGPLKNRKCLTYFWGAHMSISRSTVIYPQLATGSVHVHLSHTLYKTQILYCYKLLNLRDFYIIEPGFYSGILRNVCNTDQFRVKINCTSSKLRCGQKRQDEDERPRGHAMRCVIPYWIFRRWIQICSSSTHLYSIRQRVWHGYPKPIKVIWYYPIANGLADLQHINFYRDPQCRRQY